MSKIKRRFVELMDLIPDKEVCPGESRCRVLSAFGTFGWNTDLWPSHFLEGDFDSSKEIYEKRKCNDGRFPIPQPQRPPTGCAPTHPPRPLGGGVRVRVRVRVRVLRVRVRVRARARACSVAVFSIGESEDTVMGSSCRSPRAHSVHASTDDSTMLPLPPGGLPPGPVA
jgi:hypothetical protein